MTSPRSSPEANMAQSQPLVNGDQAHQWHECRPFLMKIFATQSGFFRSTKKLLCLTNKSLQVYDFGGAKENILKLEIKFNDIVSLCCKKSTKKDDRAELVVEHRDSRGKKLKETFVVQPSAQQALDAAIHKLKMTPELEKTQRIFTATKITKNDERKNLALSILGPTITRLDSQSINRPRPSLNLWDIAHIFRVKDHPDMIFITFRDSYRTHLYSVKDFDSFKHELLSAFARTLNETTKQELPSLERNTIDEKFRNKENLIMLRYQKRIERAAQEMMEESPRNKKSRKSIRYEPAQHVLESPNMDSEGSVEKERHIRSAIEFSFTYFAVRVKPDGSRVHNRFLCGNHIVLAEMDENRRIVNVHDMIQVHALVRYIDSDMKFAVEYKTGHVYRYESTQRDGILLDIVLMTERNGLGIVINFEETMEGVKEGPRMHPMHVEYASILFARLSKLDREQPSDAMSVLREFNMCMDLISFEEKDRAILRSLVRFLNRMEFEKESDKSMLTVLGALLRMLHSKPLFDDAAAHKDVFQRLLTQLLFDSGVSPMVRFYVACIALCLCGRRSSDKSDVANQNMILTELNLDSMMQIVEKEHATPRSFLVLNAILHLFCQVLETNSVDEISKDIAVRLYELRHVLQKLSVSMQHFRVLLEAHFSASDRCILDDYFHNSGTTGSLTTATTATRLLVSVFVRLDEQDAFQLQQEVLDSGLLAFKLYESLFADGEQERKLSALFVDHMVSFFEPSIRLMHQLVPQPLLGILNDKKQRRPHTETKKSLFQRIAQLRRGNTASFKLQSDTQDWAQVLHAMQQQDIETAHCIWNDATRTDLREALEFQLYSLVMSKARSGDRALCWNYEEFNVVYKSLVDEVCVRGYFIKYLTSTSDDASRINVSPPKVEEPLKLVTELYYRLMLEERDEVKIMCARSLSFVYITYLSDKNVVFPHLEHFINHVLRTDFPRAVQFEILLLISNVMTVWVNKHHINHKIIPLTMRYMSLVHRTREIDHLHPDPGSMASICLNIMHQLAEFRTGHLQDGEVMQPVPRAILEMTHERHLPHIVQLLLADRYPNLSTLIYDLLFILLKFNNDAVPHLYKSGFFYFLFHQCGVEAHSARVTKQQDASAKDEYRKVGDDDQIGSNDDHDAAFVESGEGAANRIPSCVTLSSRAAQILGLVHMRQEFCRKDFGLSEKENTTTTTTTTAHSGSFLDVFLPSAMVSLLRGQREKHAANFAHAFNSDHESPRIVWNADMRAQLYRDVTAHISQFKAALSEACNNGSFDVVYQFEPMPVIQYDKLQTLQYVGGFYLDYLLLPEFRMSFPIENPQRLFDEVADHYCAESSEHKLTVYLDTMLLLLERFNKASDRAFISLDKCSRIVATSIQLLANVSNDRKWDALFVERIVQLLDSMFEVPNNCEEAIRVNGHEVFVDLLMTVFLRGFHATSPHEKVAEQREALESILWRTMVIVKQLCRFPATVEVITTATQMPKLLNYCLFVVVDNVGAEVYRAAVNLTVTLCRDVHTMRRIWESGMPAFLLRRIIACAGGETAEDRMHLQGSTFVLANMVSSSSAASKREQGDAKNFVLQDLEKVIPRLICSALLRGDDDESRVQFVRLLTTDVERPDLIWSENMRRQLLHYIDRVCAMIQAEDYQPAAQIALTDPLLYDDLKSELKIEGVFLRVFNKEEHNAWAISSDLAIRLANGIIRYLGSRPTSTVDVKICVLALLNIVLRCQIQDKSGRLFGDVVQCLASGRNISTLTSLLKWEKSNRPQAKECYLYVLLILNECRKMHWFLERIVASDTIHLLTYVMSFALFGPESGDQSDETIAKILSTSLHLVYVLVNQFTQLAIESSRNGILLYALVLATGTITCGGVASDTIRQSSMQIVRTMALQVTSVLVQLESILPTLIVSSIADREMEMRTVVDYFDATHMLPNLIWDDSTRQELRTYLHQEVLRFQSIQHSGGSNIDAEWTVPEGFQLKYSAVGSELQIGGVFVRLYVEHMRQQQRTPFKIGQPREFLEGLVEHVLRHSNSMSDCEIALFAMDCLLQQDRTALQDPCLKRCILTLFKFASVPQSDPQLDWTLLKIIHMAFMSNEHVRSRIKTEPLVLYLFDRIKSDLQSDFVGIVLFVIYVFAALESQVVKQIVDADKADFLLCDIIADDDKVHDERVKVRAAFVLKAMSRDREYGKDVSDRFETDEEYAQPWHNFVKFASCPSSRVPFPPNLSIFNGETLPPLHSAPESDNAGGMVTVDDLVDEETSNDDLPSIPISASVSSESSQLHEHEGTEAEDSTLLRDETHEKPRAVSSQLPEPHAHRPALPPVPTKKQMDHDDPQAKKSAPELPNVPQVATENVASFVISEDLQAPSQPALAEESVDVGEATNEQSEKEITSSPSAVGGGVDMVCPAVEVAEESSHKRISGFSSTSDRAHDPVPLSTLPPPPPPPPLPPVIPHGSRKVSGPAEKEKAMSIRAELPSPPPPPPPPLPTQSSPSAVPSIGSVPPPPPPPPPLPTQPPISSQASVSEIGGAPPPPPPPPPFPSFAVGVAKSSPAEKASCEGTQQPSDLLASIRNFKSSSLRKTENKPGKAPGKSGNPAPAAGPPDFLASIRSFSKDKLRKVSDNHEPQTAGSSSDTGDKNDLLSAIRGFNRSKLRKVEEQPSSSTTASSPSSPGGHDDLLASIRNFKPSKLRQVSRKDQASKPAAAESSANPFMAQILEAQRRRQQRVQTRNNKE